MSKGEEIRESTLGDKYRVGSLIANGGMGAVYSGTHVQLDRPVAIKILRPELTSDAVAQSRFLREAQAAARIEHANAVRVYDYGTLEHGGAYLVMEFVDGVSLRELLVERSALPLETAVDLVAQAASALEAAHARGVVHRDVKPENLMISCDDSGRMRLRVVDFGIAKLLAEDGSTQLTRPAELIGTPRYMAPELFSDDPVDGRVDVYALGTVFFEMLTGRTPFEGTYGEVIGKHLFSEPPPIAALGIEVPERIEAAVRRALAKSADDRFSSPAELATELAAAAAGEFEEAVAIAPTFSTGRVGASAATGIPAGATSPFESDTTACGAVGGPLATLFGQRPETAWHPRIGASLSETAARARELVGVSMRTRPRKLAMAAAAASLAGVFLVGPTTVETQQLAVAAPTPAPVVAAPAVVTMEIDPEVEGVAARGDAPTIAPAPARGEMQESRAERQGAKSAVARRETRGSHMQARRENPLAPVGRALRVDRHLRRLF